MEIKESQNKEEIKTENVKIEDKKEEIIEEKCR